MSDGRRAMPSERQPEHPAAMLSELAAGTLDAGVATEVRHHVNTCPECAAELAGWRAVGVAVRARASRVAPPAAELPDRIARQIVERSRLDRPDLARRAAWLVAFVRGQVAVVRRQIWSASTIVLVIGAAISLLPERGSVPGAALALLAPLAAAVSVAMVYGQENDPSLELALATPTSPRLVVVARLTIVLAWDLALTLVASAALVALAGRPDALAALIGLWLGPMLLLGCLTLALSLVVGTTPSIAIAFVVWIVRAAEVTSVERVREIGGLMQAVDVLWQTGPLTIVLAAAALAFALVLAPRQSPAAGGPV